MNYRFRRKPERKSNKKFLIFLLIVILGLGFFKMNYNSFKKGEIITKTREITITKNDNFSNLWKKIEELDTFYYKIYLKYNKPTFTLQEGVFKIESWDNFEKLFKNLQKPLTTTENLTILPGWNIYDIDKYLIKKWLISEWEFISYVTNKEKIDALKEFFPFLDLDSLETLEGYLYPDTYTVDSKNFKINTFVIKVLEEFEKRVYEKSLKWKFDNAKINEIVNLASILQKEETIEANQPTVAWILKKRLNENWQIWADATVCYPQKLPTSECTQKKVVEFLYEKNEYNTRTMTWLPKTPIANPTEKTILATINDEKTDYWFYLHDLKTGQIYYAKTNAEHEQNKKNVYGR